MVHLKNAGYSPKNAFGLLKEARKLNKNLNCTIRDVRVSRKYVELDVSIPKENLDELLNNLKPIGNLDHTKKVVEQQIKKEEAIKEGIFFFNNERFWECHEVLEGVWNRCFEGEKDLVQGIILVAAAFVHYQKDENNICISILGRAMEKLGRSSGKYNGIDIDKLRNNVTMIQNSGKITTFEI